MDSFVDQLVKAIIDIAEIDTELIRVDVLSMKVKKLLTDFDEKQWQEPFDEEELDTLIYDVGKLFFPGFLTTRGHSNECRNYHCCVYAIVPEGYDTMESMIRDKFSED